MGECHPLRSLHPGWKWLVTLSEEVKCPHSGGRGMAAWGLPASLPGSSQGSTWVQSGTEQLEDGGDIFIRNCNTYTYARQLHKLRQCLLHVHTDTNSFLWALQTQPDMSSVRHWVQLSQVHWAACSSHWNHWSHWSAYLYQGTAVPIDTSHPNAPVLFFLSRSMHCSLRY